jgi:hypothetical protein
MIIIDGKKLAQDILNNLKPFLENGKRQSQLFLLAIMLPYLLL